MVLTEIYDVLHDIIEGLDYFIPFKTIVPSITLIIILTAISVVPIHILNILSERKHHELYRYPYITSTLIWIVAALLFITH